MKSTDGAAPAVILSMRDVRTGPFRWGVISPARTWLFWTTVPGKFGPLRIICPNVVWIFRFHVREPHCRETSCKSVVPRSDTNLKLAVVRHIVFQMMKQFLVVAIGSLLFACSDPPNVSATCSSDVQCDEGLTCNTAVPGGYCTKACTTPGETSQCPEASVCDSVAGTAVSCVKICDTSSDCRSDLSCNGTSKGSLKACKPKV